MDLDQLAVRAKRSEKALVRLIKETERYRGIKHKFPASSKMLMDVDGELIALTWEMANKYDPERYVKFVTLLLCAFKNLLAREWMRYARRKHVKMLGLIGGTNTRQVGARLDMHENVSSDGSFELRIDVEDLLEKSLFGSEKLLFARTIIGKDRVADVAKELGITLRRAYAARRNVLMLVKFGMRHGVDLRIMEVFRLSVMIRGLCDDAIRVSKLNYKEDI